MFCKEESQIFGINQMLRNNAELYSNRPAFWLSTNKRDTGTAITYDETYNDVCGLGTSLIARGMKGKRIAIVGVNSYQWAVSYLSAISGTGVAVPLDKELSISELKYFLNITGCSCVIFSGELEDVFLQIENDGVTGLEMLVNMDKENSEWNILSLQELIDEGKELAASGNHSFANTQIMHEDLCAIIHTAGTTGISKGVLLSHKNITAELALLSSVLNITENDVFLSRLPLHCAQECICSILLPLFRGASIAYCEGIPYNYEISKIAGYQLTECSSFAALSPDNGSAVCFLPGMKAKIADPDPETGIGEICLAGDNIMMGYCGNPKATREVLKDGWLLTGDLGWIDKKGHLCIAGRKEIVIIAENGKIVNPEELENYLNCSPYILESMVWSKASDGGGASITATIWADENKVNEKLVTGFSERELKDLLSREIGKINDRLPFFKQINNMVLRKESFQKNSAQKIMRWYPANRQ